jgi:membrane protease YdiL (CAAX protease family)
VGGGLALTAVLFALLHGVWLDTGWSIQVDLVALRNAAVTGLACAWLRARRGSLLLPVAAHGLVDFLFFLPRMR